MSKYRVPSVSIDTDVDLSEFSDNDIQEYFIERVWPDLTPSEKDEFLCRLKQNELHKIFNTPTIETLEDELKMDAISEGFGKKSLTEIQNFFNS